MTVGARTVLSIDRAKRAVSTGARFIVSPGLNLKVMDWCERDNFPITPSVVPPTEAEMAPDRKPTILWCFPAEAMGGATTVKALAAVYNAVRFIPIAGVNERNLEGHLPITAIHCCGVGS